MPDQRVFHAPQLDMGRLVQALADWYRAEKFDVQVLDLPQGGVVIQARREEAWRTLLGVSSAYGAWQQSKLPQRTFGFIQHYIATGGTLPADTAAGFAGRYQEAQQVVRTAPAAGGSPTSAPSGTFRFCPSCGAEQPAGARFCPSRGARLEA